MGQRLDRSLYHYCSTAAFCSIVETKSVWLSSLSASNDSQEGRWFTPLFLKLASRNKGNSVWPAVALAIGQILHDLDCLGFCLTTKADMLSQWRGYAEDATGFAIGFNPDLFALLSWSSLDAALTLQQVQYEETEQLELLRNRLAAIHMGLPAESTRSLEEMDEALGRLVSEDRSSIDAIAIIVHDLMFLAKNPAFAEEDEYRLIMNAVKESPIVRYRQRGPQIVPYRIAEFPQKVQRPILKVYIGPKNPTPDAVVRAFLKKNGLYDVDVERSKASYR